MKLKEISKKSCSLNDFQDSLEHIFQMTSDFSKFSLKTNSEKS